MADFIISIVQSAPATALARWAALQYSLINEAIDAYISHYGNDLPTSDHRLIIECEAWTSTENVTLGHGTGRTFVSDSTRYLWIRVKEGHRWNGYGEGSGFRLRPTTGDCFYYYSTSSNVCNYMRIEGIEFDGSAGASKGMHHKFANTNYPYPIYISRCIFHDFTYGIHLDTDNYRGNYPHVISACLGYALTSGMVYQTQYKELYIINCTGFCTGGYVYDTWYISGISENVRVMNSYGKNDVGNAYDLSKRRTHTNYNISGKAEDMNRAYAAGSVGGSNQCHNSRGSYLNVSGEQQDGTKADFRVSPDDTALKGEGYKMNTLSGYYRDGLRYGHDGAEFLDILYNKFPTDGSDWDVGAFSTYVAGYTISSTAGEHGAIDPAGDTFVAAGGDQSYLILPDDLYEIDQIIVDDALQPTVNPYKFTGVSAGHTIRVTFRPKVPAPGEPSTEHSPGIVITERVDEAENAES